jgi:hypothetical protein
MSRHWSVPFFGGFELFIIIIKKSLKLFHEKDVIACFVYERYFVIYDASTEQTIEWNVAMDGRKRKARRKVNRIKLNFIIPSERKERERQKRDTDREGERHANLHTWTHAYTYIIL